MFYRHHLPHGHCTTHVVARRRHRAPIANFKRIGAKSVAWTEVVLSYHMATKSCLCLYELHSYQVQLAVPAGSNPGQTCVHTEQRAMTFMIALNKYASLIYDIELSEALHCVMGTPNDISFANECPRLVYNEAAWPITDPVKQTMVR